MPEILLSIAVPVAAVSLAVVIHGYAVRQATLGVQSDDDTSPRRTAMKALAILFLAHSLEIAVFAIGHWVLFVAAPTAYFTGSFVPDARDFLYFSAASYTSLGLGDIQPHGPLRLLTGVEALTGLILIAWTAAFLFEETRRQFSSSQN